MKQFTAYIGLAILTVGLSACTGGSTGSADFVPQSHANQVQDIGGNGGGPQSQSRQALDLGGNGGGPQ